MSVFVTSCIPFQALIACNRPDAKIIVQTQDPKRIHALDYDPINNTIYYVQSEDWRNPDNNEQHIISYDVETGEKTIIDRRFTHLSITWVGIGRQGELYLLVRGRNPYNNPDKLFFERIFDV